MAHSVNVTQKGTGVATPVLSETGLPFVVGVAPLHLADHPAAVGSPIMLTSWAEAVDQFGYSSDWSKYGLCEVMYSHFKLFQKQPVIFVNLLDPETMKTAQTPQSTTVVNHKCDLGADVIASSVVVKASTSAETPLDVNEDYSVYYDDIGNCIVEVLPGGSAYSATALVIGYDKVSTAAITTSYVAMAFEKADLCITKFKVVPDIFLAPGYSDDSVVASAMVAKAGAVSGLFTAKALLDISTTSAATYSAAIEAKNNSGLTAPEAIYCWPCAAIGNLVFHLSTLEAGRMAATDGDNNGIPYESPSNKALPIDRLCLASGALVEQTLDQANALERVGIATALNFINGWVAWGNYTAAYPSNTDVKDYFIPVSRMFGWVGNTLILTFWSKLDAPMNRRRIHEIIDSANIWLNGLSQNEYLLGARVEMIDAENPLSALMSGIVKIHIYITPPAPMQEIDFVLEYDASYVPAALMS